MLTKSTLILFLIFATGLFCQEINLNNFNIEKTTIKSRPLYEIGDLDNEARV